MALYKSEGIVLRTRNLGEADRIITLHPRTRQSRRRRTGQPEGTQPFDGWHPALYTWKVYAVLGTLTRDGESSRDQT